MILALLITSVVSTADPETIIEMSVGNYAKTSRKKTVESKREPSLPKDYGQRVAAAIESQRPSLLDCIGSEELQAKVDAEISVSSAGVGVTKITDEAKTVVTACIEKILNDLHYPEHPLKKAVLVKLPLSLERVKE